MSGDLQEDKTFEKQDFSERRPFDGEFQSCTFKDCNFMESDLSEVTFNRTDLRAADLRSAYGFSIDPGVNRLQKARFSHSGLPGLLSKYDLIVE